MAAGDQQVLIQGCRMKGLEYVHRGSSGSDPGVHVGLRNKNMATGVPQVLIQGCRMKEQEYGHRGSSGSDPRM